MLGREAILDGATLRQVEVNVPRFGGPVIVKELSAQELVEAYATAPKDQSLALQGAHVLVRAIYVKDATSGELVRLFQDDDGPRFARISRTSYRAIEAAFNELHGGGAEGESDATGG
jgi:hypothetical protein